MYIKRGLVYIIFLVLVSSLYVYSYEAQTNTDCSGGAPRSDGACNYGHPSTNWDQVDLARSDVQAYLAEHGGTIPAGDNGEIVLPPKSGGVVSRSEDGRMTVTFPDKGRPPKGFSAGAGVRVVIEGQEMPQGEFSVNADGMYSIGGQTITGNEFDTYLNTQGDIRDRLEAIIESRPKVVDPTLPLSQGDPPPSSPTDSPDFGDRGRVPFGDGLRWTTSPFQLQQQTPGQRNDGVGGQGNAPVDFPSQGGIIWSMDTNYVPFTEDRNVDYYVGEAGYWFWILFLVFGFSCRRFSLCSNLLGTPEGLLMSRAH